MKKALIILLIFTALFLSGCFRYGSGQQTGYVSAMETSWFWKTFWKHKHNIYYWSENGTN